MQRAREQAALANRSPVPYSPECVKVNSANYFAVTEFSKVQQEILAPSSALVTIAAVSNSAGLITPLQKERRRGDCMDATPSTLNQQSSASVEQHSVLRTLVLHLLPGALVLVFFVAIAPILWGLGFPSAMAIYLAFVFVLLPFELGYLIYEARERGTSLGDIVLYRQPVPRGQFFALVGALFVWGIIMTLLLSPVDSLVKESLFAWLPGWLDYTNGFSTGGARFSTTSLLITLAFGLIANGIAAPVVEEMYFRGYLLPRISRFGAWAPIINTVLFSLYHFFSLFGFVSRTLTFLPMVYAAWWKRNIYLSMSVHILGNLFGAVLPLLLIVGVLGSGSS